MPSALWERVSPSLKEFEEYVAAEEVLDTYSGPLCTVGVIPSVFTLSGKVTDAKTGKPIAGVGAALDTKPATTNQDGSYLFTNLAAGTYYIVFVKPGYSSVKRNITISKDTVLNVQMTLVPPEKKAFPWWILGVAGGSLALIAIAATKKKR